jgi:hypothetical protein
MFPPRADLHVAECYQWKIRRGQRSDGRLRLSEQLACVDPADCWADEFRLTSGGFCRPPGAKFSELRRAATRQPPISKRLARAW